MSSTQPLYKIVRWIAKHPAFDDLPGRDKSFILKIYDKAHYGYCCSGHKEARIRFIQAKFLPP